MVAGVPGLVQDLGTRRTVVRMHGGRELVAALGAGGEGQHHVGRGQALGIDEVVALALAQHVGANGIQKSRFLIIRLISAHHAEVGRDWPGSSGCPARGRRTPCAPGAARHHAVARPAARRCAPRSARGSRHAVPLGHVTRADHRLGLLVGHARGRDRPGRRAAARAAGPDARTGRDSPGRPRRPRSTRRRRRGTRRDRRTHSSSASRMLAFTFMNTPPPSASRSAAVALVHQPRPSAAALLEQPLRAAGDGVEAQAERGAQRGAGSARRGAATRSGAGRPSVRPKTSRSAAAARSARACRRRRAPCPSPCTRARRTSCRAAA